MPFPGRVSMKLLFYNITRPFSYPTATTIPSNILPSLSTLRHRYFNTNREGRDDPFSEDQNRDNFQFPPDPIPNRPLRGDRRPPRPCGNAGFDHVQPKPSPHQFPRTQFQNRPRQARRDDGRFNDDLFTADNLEMGGEESQRPSSPRNSQFRAPYRSIKEGIGEDELGEDSFLEKFKLGDEKKSVPEEKASTPDPKIEAKTTMPDGPPENADEIFNKMKEIGLIPNAVAMLDGLCKDGLVQEAMKLFGLMREKGTIPEVVIYTAVVEGFCKALKFEDAKRIFRKMQNNGISPNAFSYTVLIQGLCKGKSFEDAVDFCVEMLEAGHSPNVATFTTLIDGFCRVKGKEEAENIVRRLREKGFFLNEKAVREHMDKKGPFSPLAWEAIFGKQRQRPF